MEDYKADKYEYLKVTNGKWGDYGNWTAWSTTKVSETDYRKVEVKTEKVSKTCSRSESSYLYDTIDATPSTYTYCQSPYTEDDKGTCSRTATGYYTAKCPSGYTLNSDGTCTGTVATTTTTMAQAIQLLTATTTIRTTPTATIPAGSHSNTNFRLCILRNTYSKGISIKEIYSFQKYR